MLARLLAKKASFMEAEGEAQRSCCRCPRRSMPECEMAGLVTGLNCKYHTARRTTRSLPRCRMKVRRPTLKGRAERHSHFGGCGVARRTKHPFGGGGGGCHTENAQFPAVLFVLSPLFAPIQIMAGEILDLISLPLSGLPPSLMFRSPRRHKGNGRSLRLHGMGERT